MANPTTARVAEQLLADRVITPAQYEGALRLVRAENLRLEDALIDAGAIAEGDLLKHLAKHHRTRFVLTDKLARVEVERHLLDMLPRAVAERHGVFPVLYDAAAETLSVVSPDPGDDALVAALQAATGARAVRVYLARPAAVRAAILKHYAGDLYAFANLDRREVEQYRSLLDLYDRSTPGTRDSQVPPLVLPDRARSERVLTDKDLGRPSLRPSSVDEGWLETVTVLVSLLENGRGEHLRGHSAAVARMIRKLAEHIGLPPGDVLALAAAALLHDVGKAGSYHLTALNVAEYENHRALAQALYLMPTQLFEAAPLGEQTVTAIQRMYERFDGEGFPDGLAGREIPLGGRLLALADTYADLTQNPQNAYRKALSAAEACDVLEVHKYRVFDPNLVDLVRHVALGDDLRAKLLASRPVVLLLDPDPEETTVLELRLLEHGFDVRAVRAVDDALKALERGDVELAVTEVALGDVTGLDLLAHVRGASATRDLPWVFVTRDKRREVVARAYELGVADYVVKPAATDVLIAKLRQVLAGRAERARGVVGSLAEIALTDIIQVVSQGRKTGKLTVREGSLGGEVHFLDGAVVNAMWGDLRGEEAVYAMLAAGTGEFALDPAFRPPARVIHAGVESLLLEGVRRLDEARAARAPIAGP